MLANSQSQSHGAAGESKQARALTGTVTKLLDNFGFIDDSVFFQLSVVKGGDVAVGDKVYCECSYSEHLPFKWNATKVHLVQTNARPPPGQTQTPQSPQVATTYLQHRLQQQSARDDSTAPIGASGAMGNAHNYYSSQSPGYASQIDYTKAQQAVAAAQQLASYYGAGTRGGDSSNQTSFSQLQYTSTPGSAFVSNLPFTQQIQQNLLSTQPRAQTTQPAFKANASRWERDEPRDRFRPRDRKQNESRAKDEFGRDLRANEKSKERERDRKPPKRSVSPTSSVSSQNQVVRAARRRYEPVNIPKLTILKTPLNVYDIKQRYSANLHVPSDLKEVIINKNFVLNINEMPKPITFRVIETKDDSKKKEKKNDSHKDKESDKKEEKTKEKNANKDKPEEKATEVDDSNGKTEKSETKTSVEPVVVPKQSYKYCVKVLLISVPSLNDIFERIFGSDFDAISTGSKSYFLHFNKLLSFLVSRNSNDGFSLIGGKFNPNLDGYLSDSEEPNLIATAIRVVGEQTGMNLNKCGKWKLIATFVFNRDSSVDPTTSNLELTRVYMPDVWSAFETIYEPLKDQKNVNELENDNQIVLSNDKLENNSQVIVNCEDTNDKNESISAEDNTANDSDPPKATTDPGVDSQPDSNIAMDLSQTISGAAADDSQPMDAQPTDSSLAIVDPHPSSDLVQSDPPIGESSVVDHSSVPTDVSSAAPADESSVVITDESINETNTSSTSGAIEKSSSGDASELQQLLSRINDLKVAELRAELEKRGARLKGSLKKADLISKLRQLITKLLEDEDVVSDEVKNDWWAQRILSKETSNEETEDTIEEKTDPKEGVDEEVLLKDDETNKETDESRDVVMTENSETTAAQGVKEEEIVDQINEKENEEQMVVDLTNDNKDNVSDSQPKETEKDKITQNGTVKRKSDSEESPVKDTKKVKNGENGQKIPTKVTDGCVYVKGSDNLTVITLHEALNHQRYDQFEMSVVSEVIRESLIHHFSHYILSTLVSHHKHPLSKEEKSVQESKSPMPVNYVHLSFSYFDSSHCGHLLAEDLNKLLCNANFTLSRKAFSLLVNNEDKVIYRDLPEPKDLLPIGSVKVGQKSLTGSEDSAKILSDKIYERNGTVYDIEKLIDQSETDVKIKVRLNEELTTNKEKISQMNEYVHELENRQKKMTIATEKQNDEICSLKRDREVMKKEFDAMKKAVENSYSEFGKILGKNDKKDSENPKDDK